MIIFKKVKWKNLLSTGNNWTELNLNDVSTTLIIGHNGSGKSTMLDALSFGLFGKPHRKISKPQLINTINNKKMLVEVDFDIGTDSYKVIRGMKPNVFQIWKNDKKINQDSHSKQFQELLEKNIIKLNHKSFHQIVVLGSSSFVPFMQLTPQIRREIIEDLLDINVFSRMNFLLKERISLLKQQISDNSHSIDISLTKIEGLKKYINDLDNIKQEQKTEKQKKLKELIKQIDLLTKKGLVLENYVKENQSLFRKRKDELVKSIEDLKRFRSRITETGRNLVKNCQFFENHEECPTCSQNIDDSLKSEKIRSYKDEALVLNKKMNESKEMLTNYEVELKDVENNIELVHSKKMELVEITREVQLLVEHRKSIEEEITKLQNIENDLNVSKKDLSKFIEELESLKHKKILLNEQMSYNMVNMELLKDSGIKTKIIKQYIPVINKLTNQYLNILDFYVHFDLNESFNETIRSRHRDSFSYDSFSEGEKQRIDLSLLFTWRQIAKMKNSVATNLLVLDETFDSSLDEDGIDNLMKILNSLDESTNVFVISHKPELDGQFSRTIQFSKDKNFSKITKVNIDI